MLRLRTAALAAVLALGVLPVAGCGGKIQQAWSVVQGAEVPAGAALAARGSFNIAEAGGTNYLRLRRCNGSNGPVCRDPQVTPRLIAAMDAGRDARNLIAGLQRKSPDGNIPVASYNTLIASTNVINSLTAAYRAAAGK